MLLIFSTLIISVTNNINSVTYNIKYVIDNRKVFKLFLYIINMPRIEELRSRLCYGREKEAKEVNEAIELLFKLKKKLEELK